LAQSQALVDSVTQLLGNPEFSEIFAEGSMAEASLSGSIGGQVISGQVDRLRVTDERVLVVDFKSNRAPPATPDLVHPAYLRQMAAYRALLQQIFPGRTVEAGLLWTEAPALMWLDAQLIEKFAPVPSLDDGGPAP
jgi:ATP-dependent helicase/nuclease subunit A